MPTFYLKNKMKYLFFISWFRAREKKLADRVDFDRMIGATSTEESFKILNDTDYAPYLSGETHNDVEKIIEKERAGFRKNLLGMGLDKDVLEVLFLKDDLEMISIEAKEKIFEKKEKEKKISEKEKEKDIFKEIKNRDPQEPHEIDGIMLEIYLQKVINFLRKNKEKETERIFENYKEVIKRTNNDLVARDEALLQIEEELIEKSKEKISGVMPILAFFIKKRRAECVIRSIFAGRKIGLKSKEIYELIDNKRAL